ncbi:unnamed protein product [Aspergillus oryzae RIB40]|uniref:DNA, SC003 n=1 Tax=Aspergillus oryzae (strain ATCC 42149 / RIB 40) TaxID=510516 RepID=Q2UMB9_ASPOR|nr:unnamed protein product [Aspergillus oryzae RIB40]BAE57296.1 unnamed protein product [Aspergillus oryzae RIB40]
MAGSVKRPASTTGTISPPPVKRKIESTLTKQSVSSFFTPASQKKPEQITWRIVNNSLVVGKYAKKADHKQTIEKPKVAAFDLVGMHLLGALGRCGRLTRRRTQHIPLSVYAATLDDGYRKPRIGMWKEFLDDYDFDVNGVDLSKSIYVGDAAGRPNDHSQVDRGFAVNAGVPFKTPEEFFLNAAPEPLVESFDPSLYLQSDQTDDASPPFSRQSALELVIFCGSPGAGKSTFYWDYLEPLGYERVNQDILKTDPGAEHRSCRGSQRDQEKGMLIRPGQRPKCIKVAKEHLTAGRSVVVGM